MSSVIMTDSLTKQYGKKTVVDRLDLNVPAGSIYGFLGPNGAGKSTTLKLLLRSSQGPALLSNLPPITGI